MDIFLTLHLYFKKIYTIYYRYISYDRCQTLNERVANCYEIHEIT